MAAVDPSAAPATLSCEVAVTYPNERAASIASTSFLAEPRAPVTQTVRVRQSTLTVTVQGPESSRRDIRTQCHALLEQLHLITKTLEAFDD